MFMLVNTNQTLKEKKYVRKKQKSLFLLNYDLCWLLLVFIYVGYY